MNSINLSNFNKIYNTVLNQHLKNRYQHIIFQYFSDNIINQIVKIPQLIPIPEQLFSYINNNFKNNNNKLFKYSYNQIYKLCYNFDYFYAEQFKNNISKFALNPKANLLILYCKYEQIQNILKQENFSFEQINFYKKSILSKDNGRTFYSRLQLDKISNTLIYISADNSKLDGDSQDTLQHELTHFIQHTIGLNKTISKINKKSLEESNIQLNKILNIFSKFAYYPNYKNNIFKLINYALDDRQIIQTAKKICCNFQRIYQRQYIQYDEKFNIIKYNYSKVQNSSEKEKFISQRIKWLNTILEKINDSFYFNSSEFLQYISILFDVNKSDLLIKKYNQCVTLMLYFCLKAINYNIDQKLYLHFKNFNIREEF